MRLSKWRAHEVFTDIYNTALENGIAFMDEVVKDAKRRCPVGTITREGNFVSANISFTPKTGKNKGRLVQFGTNKRWSGRQPGSLRSTIRRVNKPGTGSIRIYAGNFKIYWAHMVERGTSRTKAQPFLRPAFFAARNRALKSIKGR